MNRLGGSSRLRFAVPWGIGWVWSAMLLLVPAGTGLAGGGPLVEGRVTILDREGHPKAEHDGVVVFLDELEHPPPLAPPQARPAIRQVHKSFIPGVLPVLAGTTIEFPNDDTVYHNVFSLSRAKPFDLGLYEQGGSQSVTFDQPGLVKVYCNIHPQMVAYVLVLANPYFTMTDREGRFIIADVPLGNATVRAWYPLTRDQPERPIKVGPEGIQDLNLQLIEQLNLEIREEIVPLTHKNKLGQEYPARY